MVTILRAGLCYTQLMQILPRLPQLLGVQAEHQAHVEIQGGIVSRILG